MQKILIINKKYVILLITVSNKFVNLAYNIIALIKKVGESSHKLELKKAVNPAINWNLKKRCFQPLNWNLKKGD